MIAWLPLIVEAFVFLLGLAGALGTLKKGQADMERERKEMAEAWEKTFDRWQSEAKGQRAELKAAIDAFHSDLSQMALHLQSVDKLAAVTQTTVDRMVTDALACRAECRVIEIWKAAANQQLRQLDPAWSGD